ncbi:hypothetical protein [Agromyces atrinae]|uniref:Uncharacterized protein n=1 Tax=Agromyces atrinae TaxID=592376 RepID=A0A852SLR5_9MICO|nr:hypothetical protein [Agromyces atrinae]NYD68327.1 hypothetical protein [Agromyces atrinae]
MRFSTTLFQQGNNTGIEVPADLAEALAASPAATRARRVEGIIAKLS